MEIFTYKVYEQEVVSFMLLSIFSILSQITSSAETQLNYSLYLNQLMLLMFFNPSMRIQKQQPEFLWGFVLLYDF